MMQKAEEKKEEKTPAAIVSQMSSVPLGQVYP